MPSDDRDDEHRMSKLRLPQIFWRLEQHTSDSCKGALVWYIDLLMETSTAEIAERRLLFSERALRSALTQGVDNALR